MRWLVDLFPHLACNGYLKAALPSQMVDVSSPYVPIIRNPGRNAAKTMKILDPYLQDDIHGWRDGKRSEGAKLYPKDTDTLAGGCISSIFCPTIHDRLLTGLGVVTLYTCVCNFSR